MEEYVVRAIEGFLKDPPDCDFQRGYLAALITIGVEAMGLAKDDPLIVAAEEAMKDDE